MDYTTPVIDVNELQETALLRGCSKFSCTPKTFDCNDYTCTGTFSCTGWY